ncbi:tyrosine-type recombinase/integrase [Enterobacter mori]|uniref:tyrosine-type recombinase/integrase n=1 Tax=Enterobacter mori TaxID=539813 RepID=UPI00311B1B10
MSVKPLTNTEIKNAKILKAAYSLYDGFGLLLYISSSGLKTWRFRYVHPLTGKRQTYTIGRYPEFSLAEAREERERLRKILSRGIDPNEVKKEEKYELLRSKANTFTLIANEWLSFKEKEGLRESTLRNYYYTVQNLIKTFESQDITKLKAVVVIEKLKVFSDKPVLLRKLICYLNAIIDHAVNSGVIEFNPLSKIRKAFPVVKGKSFQTIEKEKLPQFLVAWENAKISPVVKLAVKFQLLTMVRPSEARGARISEFDLTNKVWRIPAERMKGRREHVVPLSSQALEIIHKAKMYRRGDFLFPSVIRNKGSISSCAVFRAFEKLDFHEKLVPHGLRALASTVLNEEGFNPDVIEAALAHKSGDIVRDIYNRTTYIEKRVLLMQWWGNYIQAAESGTLIKSHGEHGLRLVV